MTVKRVQKFTKEAGRLFQCFINSWKQTQQTGGDDIPEAQKVRETGLHFVPFFLIIIIKCILAKVD